jgi:peptide/nickel transport system substrate-binding protein
MSIMRRNTAALRRAATALVPGLRSRRRWRVVLLAACAALALSVTACSSPSGASGGQAAVQASGAGALQPKSGGSITALMNGLQWPTLDPLHDYADPALLSSIFGQLFAPGPNDTLTPDLALKYTTSSDGKTINIFLRPNVKFTDGTPFNAAAVVFNFDRLLIPSNGCGCYGNIKVIQSVKAVGALDVQLKLSAADAPLVSSFLDNSPDWIASPTALRTMGEAAFGQKPVGAGPFEVVSNAASAKLVLKRNPGYWQQGRPYLDGVTFLSTSSDEADIEAMQSGQGNLSWVQDISLVEQARTTSGLTVHDEPATTVDMITLNGTIAPFNNIEAREAVDYATNPSAIVASLDHAAYPTIEGLTAPGLLFYEKNVPGYEGYNLAKAKALVRQLGGLSVTLIGFNSPSQSLEAQAVAAQWSAAGIKVTVKADSLTQVLSLQSSNSVQALDLGWGSQPDPGIMDATLLHSGSPIVTFTKIPEMDTLIDEFNSTLGDAARQKLYDQLNALVATQFVAVPLYAKPMYMVSTSNVQGVTNTASDVGFEEYEDLWLS